MGIPVNGADWSPPGEFELPEPGPCRVEIIECNQKESRSGNQMLEVKAIVCDGQVGSGAHLWDYIVLGSSFTNNKLCAILEACGARPEGQAELLPHDFVGLKGEVQVKHEVYEGQTRAKIAYWRCKPKESASSANSDVSPDGVIDEDDDIPF